MGDFAEDFSSWIKAFSSGETHVAIAGVITGAISGYFAVTSENLINRILGAIGLIASAGIVVDTAAHLWIH